ncbi:F-box protein At3g07870-like [Nicotiana tabacum]|uniref:F-box protein At3g07870-like n=3 Tax=Nicotiana TaxID=4085 RepID=A0A1S3YH44_TOBAC|nr:PREDICTED: F-box protein At3g07870-like [Nicotiana sylvestris]
MDLPMVIMLEILSKLPIKSIFCCKVVCKLWYKLLTSDPLFLNMFHKRSPFSCLLLSDIDAPITLIELKPDFDCYSCPVNKPIVLNPKFHLPPLNNLGVGFVKQTLRLIGTCNGLIGLLSKNHSIYVSNPLLGEYFKVKLPEREKRVSQIIYGFCFSEVSGQYKVLKLLNRKFQDHDPKVSELEVYTLGVDEKWRNVGKAPYPLWGSLSKVNVNGALHWLDDEDTEKGARICSFNITTEEVKPVSAPPGLKTLSLLLMLAELRNCLCLSDYSDEQHVDIWWMREYGVAESWTKDRILMDSIPRDICDTKYIPTIIWKDGEILMRSHRGTQLVSYNPKEKKFRKVHVYGCGIDATKYVPSFYSLNPSFYSLKTVMGDDFQVSSVYSMTEIKKG